MTDPEKLTALKKAYAETILNTAKEAAARVMITERKARGYQQELASVRDEALRACLRLKQIYDSKVKEAEMISLQKQQKIEELEAQLGEAEDIVGELRTELRESRYLLEKLANGCQTNLSKEEKAPNEAVSLEVREDSSNHERSVVASVIKPHMSDRDLSINRCSYKDNKDQCHYTLPSILTKRRETEGLAQMIHTVDSSMANGVLSSSVEVGDVNDGVCLHEVSSCKIVESLEMSGCADATDSISSVKDGEAPIVSPNSSQKDVGTLISLKTSPPREHENDRKLEISETEARKEEKESCENMEVSASPLCEETPVLALSKNRCIKYTFKRKRKKEVLSNLEGDSSFEESRNMKQKTVEKDDGYLESLKPSFTSESSRDVVYA